MARAKGVDRVAGTEAALKNILKDVKDWAMWLLEGRVLDEETATMALKQKWMQELSNSLQTWPAWLWWNEPEEGKKKMNLDKYGGWTIHRQDVGFD